MIFPTKKLLAFALVTPLAIVACANDGRQLTAPAEHQTTTTRPAPPTSAPLEEISTSNVALSSPDFLPGEIIPNAATCAGENIFPALSWTNIPADTVELVITLSDQTNPLEPILLWLMAGIDPTSTEITAGDASGPLVVQALNDYGNPGFGNPCLEQLPSGIRDLQFRLYMLPQGSGVYEQAPGNTSWDMVRARATESATLLARIEATGSSDTGA